MIPVNQKPTAVKNAHAVGLRTSAAATDTAEGCQGSKVHVHTPLEQPSKRTVPSFFQEEAIKSSPSLVITENQSEACLDDMYHVSGGKQRLKYPNRTVDFLLFCFHLKNEWFQHIESAPNPSKARYRVTALHLTVCEPFRVRHVP